LPNGVVAASDLESKMIKESSLCLVFSLASANRNDLERKLTSIDLVTMRPANPFEKSYRVAVHRGLLSAYF
jgi:hypothetical protein